MFPPFTLLTPGLSRCSLESHLSVLSVSQQAIGQHPPSPRWPGRTWTLPMSSAENVAIRAGL